LARAAPGARRLPDARVAFAIRWLARSARNACASRQAPAPSGRAAPD